MTLTQISTNGIKDANVNTADIADNAVTNAKIADNSVGSAKIGTGSIAANNLNVACVTTNKIADDAVSTAKIADNAVTNAKIPNGAITTHKIGDQHVTTAKIGLNAITTERINDQAVTLAKLPHGTSSNDGKFLRANNGADPTFETVTGTTINNNADNRLITGSGTANTLEGESALTFTSNTLKLDNASSKIEVGAVAADNYTNITHEIAANSGDPMRGFVAQNNNAGIFENLQGGTNQFLVLGDTDKDQSDKCLFGVSTNVGTTYYKRLELSGTGILTIGNGIKFNNDTAEVNMLDDYEEGTYVPTVNGNMSLQSSYDIFSYVKIGKTVTIRGLFYPNNNPSSNDVMTFSLPFASANYSQIAGAGGTGVMHRQIAGAANGVACYIQDNSSNAEFYKNGGSGNWQPVRNNDWQSGLEIYVQTTYFAA